MSRSCGPMSTTRAMLVSLGLVGCFGEAPPIETTSLSADASSTAPTTTATGADTTATTTGGDFIETCRACQLDQCEGYVEACNAAAGCDVCVEEPYTPTCLGNAEFRPLAACSCESCGEACDYVCPGGGDACRNCTMGSGCEVTACSGSPTCLPCLGDSYAPGCAADPDFQALRECQCLECERSCVWQCEGTAPACAQCMTTSCGAELNDCIGDAACEDCFNNPALPGCRGATGGEGNALYATLGACVCESCGPPCGLLFQCG